MFLTVIVNLNDLPDPGTVVTMAYLVKHRPFGLSLFLYQKVLDRECRYATIGLIQ